MEFRVLGEEGVGLVEGGRLGDRCGAYDVAEAGVLEKVASKGVARDMACLVASGDPGAALDQVMAIIKGRR